MRHHDRQSTFVYYEELTTVCSKGKGGGGDTGDIQTVYHPRALGAADGNPSDWWDSITLGHMYMYGNRKMTVLEGGSFFCTPIPRTPIQTDMEDLLHKIKGNKLSCKWCATCNQIRQTEWPILAHTHSYIAECTQKRPPRILRAS